MGFVYLRINKNGESQKIMVMNSELMEMFVSVLSERITFNSVTGVINESLVTEVLDYKNRRYREVKNRVPQLTMMNECIKLSFIPCNNNTIELFWIETLTEKCQGYGTEVMNHILDVADELGINIRTIPADFDHGETGYAAMKMLNRLRAWYESFGFENEWKNNKKMPTYIYKHS